MTTLLDLQSGGINTGGLASGGLSALQIQNKATAQAGVAGNALQGGQAPAAGGGFGGALQGFSFGFDVANSVGGFLNAEAAAKDRDRDVKQAFQTSLGTFQRLLGTGFNLGARQEVLPQNATLDPSFGPVPGGGQGVLASLFPAGVVPPEILAAEQASVNQRNQDARGFRPDQVVQPGSADSRLVAPGTVIATRPGDEGLDPRILDVRRNLAGLLNSEFIDDDRRDTLNNITAQRLGTALQASTQPQSGSLNASLNQLGDISAAGVGQAQTDISAATANQQFANAARASGFGFLEQLFATAGSTF